MRPVDRSLPAHVGQLLPWLLGLLALGCSGPEEVDTGLDRMEFAETEVLDDGVADSALEPIPRVRMPIRPKARVGSPRLTIDSDVTLPVPRCANQAERTGPSRSVGQVTNGGLEGACRIAGAGPGYLAVNKNGFGTDETIALLQWAAAQMHQQFPAGAPLVIGAVARPEGGHYPPHKSHQSGRDVDLGYPRTDGKGTRSFALTDAGNIDTERLWSLLEAWLAAGKLGFVFMDYELQAVLYQDLHDVGYSEAQLRPIFQYPAGPAVPSGMIRHASGHADHFHVRFRCPDTDRPGCID